jgi:integrase
MSVKPRKGSPFLWYNFTVDGERFRGSTRETEVKKARLVEEDERHRLRQRVRQDKVWSLRQILGTYWEAKGKHQQGWKTVFTQFEHLSDIIGADTSIAELDASMLIDYRAKRRGAPPKGRKIEERTINRDFAMLRAAITHCHRLHNQPLPNIDWKMLRAKEAPWRKRFLSMEEWDDLRAADPALVPIILCAVTTGLRKANVLDLDWRQIKLDRRLILLGVKGGKEHSVRIAPALMAMLSRTPVDKRKGKVFDTTNFRKRWQAALKAAGVENFRFHDLRHTFASWARQAGADIADICDALGHSSISMSMRYAHIKPDEAVTAFERVSATVLSQSKAHAAKKSQN